MARTQEELSVWEPAAPRLRIFCPAAPRPHSAAPTSPRRADNDAAAGAQGQLTPFMRPPSASANKHPSPEPQPDPRPKSATSTISARQANILSKLYALQQSRAAAGVAGAGVGAGAGVATAAAAAPAASAQQRQRPHSSAGMVPVAATPALDPSPAGPMFIVRSVHRPQQQPQPPPPLDPQTSLNSSQPQPQPQPQPSQPPSQDQGDARSSQPSPHHHRPHPPPPFSTRARRSSLPDTFAHASLSPAGSYTGAAAAASAAAAARRAAAGSPWGHVGRSGGGAAGAEALMYGRSVPCSPVGSFTGPSLAAPRPLCGSRAAAPDELQYASGMGSGEPGRKDASGGAASDAAGGQNGWSDGDAVGAVGSGGCSGGGSETSPAGRSSSFQGPSAPPAWPRSAAASRRSSVTDLTPYTSAAGARNHPHSLAEQAPRGALDYSPLALRGGSTVLLPQSAAAAAALAPSCYPPSHSASASPTPRSTSGGSAAALRPTSGLRLRVASSIGLAMTPGDGPGGSPLLSPGGGGGGGGSISADAAAVPDFVPDWQTPAGVKIPAAAATGTGSPSGVGSAALSSNTDRLGRAMAGILPNGNPGTFSLPLEERIQKVIKEGAPKPHLSPQVPKEDTPPPLNPVIIKMLQERQEVAAQRSAVESAFSSGNPAAWMHQIVVAEGGPAGQTQSGAQSFYQHNHNNYHGQHQTSLLHQASPPGSAAAGLSTLAHQHHQQQHQQRHTHRHAAQPQTHALTHGSPQRLRSQPQLQLPPSRAGSGAGAGAAHAVPNRASSAGGAGALGYESRNRASSTGGAGGGGGGFAGGGLSGSGSAAGAGGVSSSVGGGVPRHTSAETLHLQSLSYRASKEACRTLAAGARQVQAPGISLRATVEYLGFEAGSGGGGAAVRPGSPRLASGRGRS